MFLIISSTLVVLTLVIKFDVYLDIRGRQLWSKSNTTQQDDDGEFDPERNTILVMD